VKFDLSPPSEGGEKEELLAMPDLDDLTLVEGTDLTAAQIQGIIAEIDLDIVNLVRDGKLSALKYAIGGTTGRTVDRGANLAALQQARDFYQQLLNRVPTQVVSRFAP